MGTNELINAKGTFYTKKFQCNGFYPIDRFSWNKQKNKYERFVRKTNDFVNYFYKLSSEYSVSELTYLLEHNSFLISGKELKDDLNYNIE